MRMFLETLLRPGVRAMQVTRLPLKFAIISAAFLVPLGVAVYAMWSYAGDNIQFAYLERVGVHYTDSLNALARANLDLHVARATKADSGTTQSITQRGDTALSELDERVSRDRADLDLREDFARYSKAWSAAKADSSSAASTAALQALLELYSNVSDKSNLTLDPDLDSYYAMAIVMDAAPKLMVATAQLRATANGSDGAGAQLAAALALTAKNSIDNALERAFAANPKLANGIDAEHFRNAARPLDGSTSAFKGEDDYAAITTATLALSAQT